MQGTCPLWALPDTLGVPCDRFVGPFDACARRQCRAQSLHLVLNVDFEKKVPLAARVSAPTAPGVRLTGTWMGVRCWEARWSLRCATWWEGSPLW
jgi:hypothetical protein